MSAAVLYVGLVLTVVAAFVAMLWLRREADRAWRMHVALRPIKADWVRFQIAIRDELTPALRALGMAAAAAVPAMQRLGEALREADRTDP